MLGEPVDYSLILLKNDNVCRPIHINYNQGRQIDEEYV